MENLVSVGYEFSLLKLTTEKNSLKGLASTLKSVYFARYKNNSVI